MKFTHYLVTRFNIRNEGLGPEYFRPHSRSPTWEAERMPLFENFCAPSVSAQINQNFVWLIFCDPNTNADIINRILSALKSITKYQLIYVNDFQEMLSQLHQITSQSIAPYVITSRLDNDDAIGRSYISDVQNNFLPAGNVVLNLLSGVNYHASLGVLTFNHYALRNPFISLIEETQTSDKMVSVMGFSHLHPMENMIVKNIKSKYSFWMTLHHRNEIMRINTGWPIFTSSISKHYNIRQEHVSISFANTLEYSIDWAPGILMKKIKYLYRKSFSKK